VIVGERKLLTPKTAAELYPLSVSLIYQMCEERRLPHYRVGGHGKRGKILIDPRDLDAFLESCRVNDPPDDDGSLTHIR
jgi:excisionase family DNA binding protein